LDKIKVTKWCSIINKLTLDYDEEDIIELALFKASIAQDQDSFTRLSAHQDLHPAIKNHVLSLAVMISCACRDIEIVSFLIKNDVDLTNLIMIDNKGIEKQYSPLSAVLIGNCNRSFLDKDLLELLFNNGVDVNMEFDGTSAYHSIISSGHEEFAIEKLKLIADINEPQYKKCFYRGGNQNEIEREFNRETYYLIEAVQKKKFKLAEAMIKMGAETDVRDNFLNHSILDAALEGPMLDQLSIENVEFIKYLFENNYVTSLEGSSFYYLFKHVEIAELVVISGLVKEEELDCYDKGFYHKAKIKVHFQQQAMDDIELIKSAHADCDHQAIKPSFIPKKNIEKMLAYYQGGYKAKFEESFQNQFADFFDEINGAVIKQLNLYVEQNWFQIHGIAKIFEPNIVVREGGDGEFSSAKLHDVLIKVIGEYVGMDVAQDGGE